MIKLITRNDIGGVRIGNDSFAIVIPNEYGDGLTDVYVFDDGERVGKEFRFLTTIQGEDVNIYDYDVRDSFNKSVKHLSGKFGVYYGIGTVALQPWDN